MAGQIYGKLKFMFYDNVMIMLYKQANTCISVSLHVSLRKSTPETGVKFFVFFTFFFTFFMKTLIKSKIYFQAVPLDHLCMLQKLYVRPLCLYS